jgi:hypothetical protein
MIASQLLETFNNKDAFSVSAKVLESLKPEVVRKRLLKGDNPHPNLSPQTLKKGSEIRTGLRPVAQILRGKVRDIEKLTRPHQSEENEEKVESPSLWFQYFSSENLCKGGEDKSPQARVSREGLNRG